MKTEALKKALDLHGFDAAFGGARRDEEKSRAKERIFSFRSQGHVWDPRNQRPELWNLFNTRISAGETIRVFPLSNWTELDIWHYIMLENIEVVPLYFAKARPVVKRGGTWIMVDDERLPLEPGEKPRDAGGQVSHARLLSPDRRHRVRCQFAGRHRRGDAQCTGIGAAGPPDRQRRGIVDGEKEARGLFLMPRAHAEAAVEGMAAKDLLRFITCGSVDDGKSTLIGRLLHDSKLILEDQLVTLAKDSERHGTVEEDIDFALLVDGLEAEREQGITIDVAYRFFTTPRRSFIVADTPGHEQYTRNMATGASNAELAIILVDARKGVLVQTRRHSLICSLLGIRHVVVAVNKMDLVGYARETFERIVGDYSTFAAQLGFTSIVPIPISARFGDNITRSGQYAVVSGPAVARLSGVDRRRGRIRRQAVPLSGAVGEPAEPRFPRLCRNGGVRDDRGRRSGRGGVIGPELARQGTADLRGSAGIRAGGRRDYHDADR